jgi:D-3-phosphoglycerate dehydrogenase
VKIAILDDYQDSVRYLACFALLAEHDVIVLNESLTQQALVEKLQDVQALVLIRERTVITESLLAQLPQLKLISQTGKISNHIDPILCQKYAVDIAQGIGSPVAPAELCWTLIMAASRNIAAYAHALQQGQWQQSGALGLGRTLSGLTLAIWGYGKIGKRIAQYAQAFAMDVIVWGSEESRQAAVKDGFRAASSKSEFFQQADIISLHLRLNAVTKGCVTTADLQQLKDDALIVNTSRAELIESGALYAQLTKRRSIRAAIDVYENEPGNTSNEPLIALDNVLALPHIGYVEQNSYELYFKIAFENVIAYAQGSPKNLMH